MAYTITELARTESINANEIKIVRVVDVSPYESRAEAYLDFVGSVRLIGGRLIRFPPLGDPDFPWCRVSDVQCAPIMDGEDGDTLATPAAANPLFVAGQYRGPARLTITYTSGQLQPEEVEDSRKRDSNEEQEIEIADQSWDYSATEVSLPINAMRFQRTDGGDDSIPTGGVQLINRQSALAPTMSLPRIEYTFTRKFMVQIPHQAILQLMNRVNKAPFNIGGNIYDPEMVKFVSVARKRAMTTFGIKFYELSYKFAIMATYDDFWDINGAVPAGSPDADVARRIKTGYVGWNRFLALRPTTPTGVVLPPRWERAVAVRNKPGENRYQYLYDQDAPSQKCGGRVVKGFNLLFNPYAR